MIRSKSGGTAQLQKKENRVILACRCGHAPNLAASDTLKKPTLCRDAMVVGFELPKLIRFSKAQCSFRTNQDGMTMRLEIELSVQPDGLLEQMLLRAFWGTTVI